MRLFTNRSRHLRSRRSRHSAKHILEAVQRALPELTDTLRTENITAEWREKPGHPPRLQTTLFTRDTAIPLEVRVTRRNEICVTARNGKQQKIRIDAPRSRNRAKDAVFLQRGVHMATVEALAHHRREETLLPSAYADAAWLAEANTMYLREVLSWRQRSRLRRRMHRVINDHDLRTPLFSKWKRAHVDAQREHMCWAVPTLESALGFHGTPLGKWRPMVDPETGTIRSATLDCLIPGLGNLPAALLAQNSAQRWQLLAATIGNLPGSLWSLLFSSARWGRKRRDPESPDLRRRAPMLDNVLSTAVGPLVSAGAQVASSTAGGSLPVGMQAQLLAQHGTAGATNAINEIQTFSPSLFAYIIHKDALSIAARGEPVAQLRQIETESRHICLALSEFLSSLRGKEITSEEREQLTHALERHMQKLSDTEKLCEKHHLRDVQFRTEAAPKRAPIVKNYTWKVLKPNIIGAALGSIVAAAVGGAAFGLLALPGLATTAAMSKSTKWFNRRKVEKKMLLEESADFKQRTKDRQLRRRLLGAVENSHTRDLPHIGTWEEEQAKLASSVPHFKQAAMISPVGAATAAPLALVDPLSSMALAVAVSTGTSPLANAAYGARWDQTVRRTRRRAGAWRERTAARLAYHQAHDINGYLEALRDLDGRLDQLQFQVSSLRPTPTWAADSVRSDLAEGPLKELLEGVSQLCKSVEMRGSAVLTRRFVQKLEETYDGVELGSDEHRERLETFLHTYLPEEEPTETVLTSAATRAEDVAAAFDKAHETDLTHAATAEFLDRCTAGYVEETERLGSLFSEAVNTGAPHPEHPRGDNERYIEYVRALSQHPDARVQEKPQGWEKLWKRDRQGELITHGPTLARAAHHARASVMV